MTDNIVLRKSKGSLFQGSPRQLVSSRLKLGTYRFVRLTGRDEHWKALAKEVAYLTDCRTGLLKKIFQEKSSCCLCRRAPSKIIFQKDCFQFHRCLRCGLIFTNPRLNEKKLYKAYRNETSNDIWVKVLTSKPQMKYDAIKYAARLQLLEKLTRGRRILDVGCSIGHFLKIAQGRGWDSYGVELSAKAHEIATKQFELAVQQKTLEQADFKKNFFDVITFWSVLEHIPDPKKILIRASQLLKRNGILLVYSPNAGSLAARVLQERARIFNGRDHLWYFSAPTLEKLLNACSFDVVRRETEVPELDTVMNYLNYNDPYKSKGKTFYDFNLLSYSQTDSRVANEILRCGLGYKIILFAKKKKGIDDVRK